MPFVVPDQFVLDELVSAAKFNTIRSSLLEVNQRLRPFSIMPFPFRLMQGARGFCSIGTLINTTTASDFADVSSFVSVGMRICIWASLRNVTTNAFVYTIPMAWMAIRPGSGNNDVTLFSSGGITIVWRVSGAGVMSFFRTGTTNEYSLTGIMWSQ